MSTALATSFRRADGTPRRVLYAEDQVTSRVVTTAMLERMGFKVDAVEDGELALSAARGDSYDVILLDIEMPVMDGVTAARSIRSELAHCAATPILALSAFLADSTEHSVWRDAFDSAVPKPANSNELMNAMTKAVAEHDQRLLLPVRPSKEDLLTALKSALPTGAWRRVSAAAGAEMAHLINALSAAQEAADMDLQKDISRKLTQIASSFGAAQLSLIAGGRDVQQLRSALADWAI
ncbi:MAG: response regulator [Aestuariivirga sp.]